MLRKVEMLPYEYHRPRSLIDALALIHATPGARFVAGGTDLLVGIRRRTAECPRALISLRSIEDLQRIEDGDGLRIGSATPLADVAKHPAVREMMPTLVRAVHLLGSPQIRNVATLGGNLCHASPAANTAPALLVHDARVELTSQRGQRQLPLEDFFVGPAQTALEPEELLTAILVDKPAPGARSAYYRRGRIRMDCATAIVAVLLEKSGNICQRARIAVGAVAPTPLRLREVEEMLMGSELSEERIAAAAHAAMDVIAPITDIRSTESYRRNITGVFVRRAITDAS